MVNPRFVYISAIVGFILSFFIGVVSGIDFLLVLLRAVVSAVLFAALAAVFSFIYNKFLSDTQVDDTAQTSNNDSGVSKTPKVGSVVDITLDEGNLPEDEDGPQFYVDNNRPSFELSPESRKRSQEPEIQSKAGSSSAESADLLGETDSEKQHNPPASFSPVDFSNAPHVSSSDTEEHEQAVEIQPETDEAIDELPDIGELVPDAKKTGDAGDIGNSSFSSGSSSAGSKDSTFSNGSSNNEKDSAVMAQAIRTLLAKDS